MFIALSSRDLRLAVVVFQHYGVRLGTEAGAPDDAGRASEEPPPRMAVRR